MMVSVQRLPMLAAGLAVATCLGFALFTGHTWEDYYITFRSSLNLATGHGLVYQPGERLHTFTSPLGTLLPALFALGGGDATTRALWCFRLVSASALAGAIWLAARAMLRDALAPFAVGVIALLWALDPKLVDFAINGMESAFVVLFVVITWNALASGAAPWRVAGGFAGLQWTRPDGFIYFGALVVAWWCFRPPANHEPARERFVRLFRGAALGLALYLPWIVIAWSYYGTPIPHTITAKDTNGSALELLQLALLYPWHLLFGHTTLHEVFMPAYFYLGGWPENLLWVSRFFAVGAVLACAWPAVQAPGRIAAGAFFLGGLYLKPIPGSPWYYPGWQALALIAWAYLIEALWRRAPRLHSGVRVVAGTLIAIEAALLIAVAWQMRAQQTIIEEGQRITIGRWLKAHARAGERVYLESLGYIGFFSGLKMFDYPGLASAEVVAAHHAGAKPHAQIIAAVRPDWIVLRPHERNEVLNTLPLLLEVDYRLVRVFDAQAAINAVTVLPGRGFLNFDSVFYLYARTGVDSTRQP